MDGIALSVFSSRIEAVCDEMGAVLKRVAFSPNIKDRLDFSCAVFDIQGELCAQAAHIPVHLGSMAYAMRDIVSGIDWQDGDMVMLNDPYLGGTHLPDVTVIAPVFIDGELTGFLANRAHHADIGAESPGSMPVSRDLHEEGQVIPPTRIVSHHDIQGHILEELVASMRNPVESIGDFSAQISANRRGMLRLQELVSKMGRQEYIQSLLVLNDYAERLARDALAELPRGQYCFEDMMDDDGQGHQDILIRACLSINHEGVVVDFTGTDHQVAGNINCPLSVAAAAVFYVFRCLMPEQTPACAGSFRPITLIAPQACLVNASRPAAVAAGNVETSTRIVDVIMGALAKAAPDKIPAASHGSMNNLAMGSVASQGHAAWDYYETIGGGMGGNRLSEGLSGVQTHMTNTLNTPVEVLEMLYPLRVNRYGIRRGSGGDGQHRGGDGLIREYEFLYPTQVTLLTERRRHAPWAVGDADSGQCGENELNGEKLPGKVSLQLKAGDRLTIKTPGGGGYSPAKSDQSIT